MKNALVGYTGFVGSNINNNTNFKFLYNSKNINEIQDKEFDLLIFSGLPGEKWKANLYPEKDLNNIIDINIILESIKVKKFILISTVDVYPYPVDCDENSIINKHDSAYGVNRYVMEKFVMSNFKDAIILRLPALFGVGLKKNILFDLLNNNQIDKINLNSNFQWYDLGKLNDDIGILLKQDFSGCINLVSEPISVSEVVNSFFYKYKKFNEDNVIQNYNVKTIHSNILGRENSYISDKKEIMNAMKNFIEKNQK